VTTWTRCELAEHDNWRAAESERLVAGWRELIEIEQRADQDVTVAVTCSKLSQQVWT